MIFGTTTNIRSAHSIEEMRQVARNQIEYNILNLKERIKYLEQLSRDIEDIVDWNSYEQVATDSIAYGDVPEAVILLANEYPTMKAGDYF